MTKFLHRTGSSIARHPWRVIGAWLLIAIVAITLNGMVGGSYDDRVSLPGTESQTATDHLRSSFSQFGGAKGQVVFHARHGTLADGKRPAAIEASVAAMAKLPHVASVTPPGTKGAISTVSKDQTTALASVSYDVPATSMGQADVTALEHANAAARTAGLQVEYGGDLIRQVEKPDVGNSDKIGLLVAAVVLVIAFGSFVAAGLPIGVALFALAVGLSLIGVLAGFLPVPSTTKTLATMIGLGVGIDYSLFIVTRHREGLARGRSVADAAGTATATAGQSVLFAGTTVVIAICGLAIAGIPFVTTLGLATSIEVAVTMLCAVTLLPALLGLAGTHIGKGRHAAAPIEADAGAGSSAQPNVWGRWAHHVGSHPWPYTVASVALLLALAFPALSMQLGRSDAGTLPESSTQRRAYDLVSDGLGAGFNGPLLVVTTGSDAKAAAGGAAKASAQVEGVAAVTDVTVSPAGTTAVFNVIPTTSPQDHRTSELTHRLRDDVLPKALAGTGSTARTTGSTSANVDLADRIGDRLPLFLAAVIGISFLLLMMVFRSVFVPLKAAICNLLSVAAGYGVVVAVFQWGWGKGAIGLSETVPIEAWVPMMMFAILFGLSMDYEVFLISRIREFWLRSGDSHQSVVDGVASTASVITSAAVIMVSVFASFILVPDPVVKMIGLGLAVAVLIDATVIRMVTVPATMELLGDANWWLPQWLDRILPSFDLEGEAEDDDTDVIDLSGAAAPELEEAHRGR